MFFDVADNRKPESLAARMRRQRMSLFTDAVAKAEKPARILDVGGTVSYWQTINPQMREASEITILNVDEETDQSTSGFRVLRGDARSMDCFGDLEFDFCFSNSVIEHVGTLHDQMAMAREVRRVSRWYFVQTPNVYFPLEPHFMMPLWPFWPMRLQSFLLQRMSLGWMAQEHDPLAARAVIDQVRLLTAKELQWLFPDARIHREKLGPLTKSMIALRLPD